MAHIAHYNSVRFNTASRFNKNTDNSRDSQSPISLSRSLVPAPTVKPHVPKKLNTLEYVTPPSQDENTELEALPMVQVSREGEENFPQEVNDDESKPTAKNKPADWDSGHRIKKPTAKNKPADWDSEAKRQDEHSCSALGQWCSKNGKTVLHIMKESTYGDLEGVFESLLQSDMHNKHEANVTMPKCILTNNVKGQIHEHDNPIQNHAINFFVPIGRSGEVKILAGQLHHCLDPDKIGMGLNIFGIHEGKGGRYSTDMQIENQVNFKPCYGENVHIHGGLPHCGDLISEYAAIFLP